MITTTKYIIVKVSVLHDESVDPNRLCEQVEIALDVEDGGITKAEVVEVWNQR